MKINEAQHAHQEMKKAEDYANTLRQQAQLQRKKSIEIQMQISKMSMDQAKPAPVQQNNAMHSRSVFHLEKSPLFGSQFATV